MLTSTQLFLVPYVLGKASQKQPWDSLFCLVISKWRPVLHLVSRESSYTWPSGPGRWQCLSYSLISGMLCNPVPLRLIYPLLHFRRPAYKVLTDHLLLHNARPSFFSLCDGEQAESMNWSFCSISVYTDQCFSMAAVLQILSIHA